MIGVGRIHAELFCYTGPETQLSHVLPYGALADYMAFTLQENRDFGTAIAALGIMKIIGNPLAQQSFPGCL
ncbi:hypothetical protein D3C75_1275510 [compost metagenome]